MEKKLDNRWFDVLFTRGVGEFLFIFFLRHDRRISIFKSLTGIMPGKLDAFFKTSTTPHLLCGGI